MATAGADHFLDLERHRQQLEENVARIQTALQHWHVCDAEYEELKEEIERVSEASKPQRDILMHQIEQTKREVVTPDELKQLFGSGKAKKSLSSITDTLQHRIDYVTKNIGTLEKQLEAAEHKLAMAIVVMDPDVSNEEGLPFTDIVEELDEDGNVVSSRLHQPGDLQPQMMEALAKVGIKETDVPEGSEKEGAVADDAEAADDAADGSREELDDTTRMDLVESITKPPTQETQLVEPKPKPKSKPATNANKPTSKKGVSFSHDTKPSDEIATGDIPPISQNAQIMAELMEQARLQVIPSSDPVIPEDESPEDAELRRAMLRYGMTDIAPIVAELEIDENGESEYDETGSDWDDDDEDAYDEDGRYKYRVVDENLHARMRELQERLGFKSTKELMQADSRMELDEDDDPNSNKLLDGGIGRITVTATPPVKSALKTGDKAMEDTSAKKGVKFANALDVAPDPDTTPADPEQPSFVDPMRTTIVERAPAPVITTPTAAAAADAPPKKVSRFKKANAATSTSTSAALPIRQAPTNPPAGPFDAPARFFEANTEVRTAPEGPEGKTIADAVVERDLPGGAREPDDFDAALLHQEAAVEYNRMRNRMIHKDGGFVKDKDAEIEYPDDVDESGKKLSRFKAARLAKQQRLS
ncbi:unnamed protein product [Discula destructiva]